MYSFIHLTFIGKPTVNNTVSAIKEVRISEEDKPIIILCVKGYNRCMHRRAMKAQNVGGSLNQPGRGGFAIFCT